MSLKTISAPLETLRWIRRLYGFRWFAGSRQGDSAIRPGIPPELDDDVLQALSMRRFGHPLRKVSHVRLSSSLRPGGTYRIFMSAGHGRFGQVIFKQAVFASDIFPEIQLHPLHPGPPEFWIYTHRPSGIRELLPELLWYREVTPQTHFVYLMEDLGAQYRKVDLEEDIIQVIELMHQIHSSVGSETVASRSELLQYDGVFRKTLLIYAQQQIRTCQAIDENDPVRELYCVAEELYESPLLNSWLDAAPRVFIHGDFGRSNILKQQSEPCRWKILDWEWCGLGLPHRDLASLLKEATPDNEKKALEIYAGLDSTLKLEDHAALYRWCRVERDLGDIAFLCSILNLGRGRGCEQHLIAVMRTIAQCALDSLRRISAISH